MPNINCGEPGPWQPSRERGPSLCCPGVTLLWGRVGGSRILLPKGTPVLRVLKSFFHSSSLNAFSLVQHRAACRMQKGHIAWTRHQWQAHFGDIMAQFQTTARKNKHFGFLVPVSCLVAKSCPIFVTLLTVTHQAPLSMGFPRQEYWSVLPFPSSGDLLDAGIKPGSPKLQASHQPEPPGKPPPHTFFQILSPYWLVPL